MNSFKVGKIKTYFPPMNFIGFKSKYIIVLYLQNFYKFVTKNCENRGSLLTSSLLRRTIKLAKKIINWYSIGQKEKEVYFTKNTIQKKWKASSSLANVKLVIMGIVFRTEWLWDFFFFFKWKPHCHHRHCLYKKKEEKHLCLLHYIEFTIPKYH